MGSGSSHGQREAQEKTCRYDSRETVESKKPLIFLLLNSLILYSQPPEQTHGNWQWGQEEKLQDPKLREKNPPDSRSCGPKMEVFFSSIVILFGPGLWNFCRK